MSEMADAIRALSAEKGISEDSIRQTIENMIKAAYRKTYPAAGDNCIVRFADDMSDVSVYARKTVVDGVYDPATEIELEDAQRLVDGAAVGDEMEIQIDPKNFVRSSVSVGKQNAHQALTIYTGETRPGKKVVMIGGGLVGCELGLHLAECGHKVTILEMLPTLANGLDRFNKQDMFEDFDDVQNVWHNWEDAE